GPAAEWLGSIAWDGWPGDSDLAPIFKAADEPAYRAWVEQFLTTRDDATRPEKGWPWPWTDSRTTDYAYAWDEGAVRVSEFGKSWEAARDGAWVTPDRWDDDADTSARAVFPDMTARQRVTLGPRSGIMVIAAKGR